ncbi:MAG: hypothetical protein EXX96DRAFT_575769 [Benjaminiella poitrasii]|nr:MAG: hypothetical protein EXX96DRAFT_575769 [Benjaminiella poitrasii]
MCFYDYPLLISSKNKSFFFKEDLLLSFYCIYFTGQNYAFQGHLAIKGRRVYKYLLKYQFILFTAIIITTAASVTTVICIYIRIIYT